MAAAGSGRGKRGCAAGVLQGVDFLRDTAMGREVPIGKEVLVIGGGNVAVDVALTAKRKGAEEGHHDLPGKDGRKCPPGNMRSKRPWKAIYRIVTSFGPKQFLH